MDANSYFVGIGEVLWDVSADGKTLGGAPANFAYHAGAVSRLIGADTQGLVVSAIGNDELGAETVSALQSVNLDYKLPVVDYPTGWVKVDYDEKGEPAYTIVEDVAWDHIPFEGLEKIAAQTRAVCFGTLAQRSPESKATIRRFLDAVSPYCMKIYDINLRSPFFTGEIVKESLVICNVLKINKEEVLYLSRLLGCETLLPSESNGWDHQLRQIAVKLCEDYGLKMVVVTCGMDGSFIFTDDGEVSFCGTPKVEQVSAVGAGDSFTGTLCACLAAGWPVRRAHEAAVAVSAYVVTQPGAMPEMKGMDRILSM